MVEVVSRGGWDPRQYDRFRDERSRPFYDLAAMVQHEPGMRVIDLGCGEGNLTAWLHGDLGARETVGIDTSDEMLAKAGTFAGNGVRFERQDILEAAEVRRGEFDLVFSNAALQWITQHETVIPAVVRMARPGGQFAIQMPANGNHPSHRLAAEVAREAPFAEALGGWVREDPVRAPEWYATLLHDVVGCTEQRVRLEIYAHTLTSTLGIVEWVKGSLLTAYRARLSEALWPVFLERYQQRLLEAVGEHAPYLYPFPRVLLWGRVPE